MDRIPSECPGSVLTPGRRRRPGGSLIRSQTVTAREASAPGVGREGSVAGSDLPVDLKGRVRCPYRSILDYGTCTPESENS